jgi:hypothetical protein
MTKLAPKRTIMTPSGVMVIINDENFVASGSSIAGKPTDVLSPLPIVLRQSQVRAHHFTNENKGE